MIEIMNLLIILSLLLSLWVLIRVLFQVFGTLEVVDVE